jgi:hypothetical protein
MIFKSPRPLKSPQSFTLSKRLLAASALTALAFAGGAFAESSAERAFMAENDAAMSKMMADMTIKPSGDIDKDFVAMMVPHHQGAIDMAQTELRYGHNEQLRRIAQEIIVGQLQEIAAMKLAIGEPLPPSAAAPTQGTPAPASEPSPHDSTPMSPTMHMNMGK